MLYQKVQLYHTESENSIFQESISYSEMSQFQQDFLCGLLKRKRPKKIVEIGVSAGGTSVIILNALKQLSINAKIFSVDVSESWYRSKNLKTGFVAKKYLEENDDCPRIDFLLGQSIPHVIDIIGREIDFLILDTMHTLPGELLDFLICLPYLQNKSIVILHDVMEDHLHCCSSKIATKLLFNLVTGKKWYMPEEKTGVCSFSNIAAFEVSECTRKNICDVFSGLTMLWDYMLSDEDVKKYMELLKMHYPKEEAEWVEKIIDLQKYSYFRKKISTHYQMDDEWLKRKWKKQKIVFLYGSAHWAKIYTEYAKINNLPLNGWVVSNDQNIADCGQSGLPVYHLKDLPYSSEECAIVLALDKRYFDTVKKNLFAEGDFMVL